MKQKISLFIQARMGSTRLPGKVLKPIGGKPVIRHLLDRLRFVQEADQIAVLLPATPNDDVLAEYLSSISTIDIFRGSEENVLARFYYAAQTFQSDIIVRITADCPFIDPQIVDATIKLFLQTKNCSYASNTIHRSFPRGLDVEVFSFQALKTAFEKAKDPAEKEHVTLYIYRHPEFFSLASLVNPINVSFLRLTVDEPIDLSTLQTLHIELCKEPLPIFHLKQIIDLYHKQPSLFLPNQDVEQKTVLISKEVAEALQKIPQTSFIGL